MGQQVPRTELITNSLDDRMLDRTHLVPGDFVAVGVIGAVDHSCLDVHSCMDHQHMELEGHEERIHHVRMDMGRQDMRGGGVDNRRTKGGHEVEGVNDHNGPESRSILDEEVGYVPDTVEESSRAQGRGARSNRRIHQEDHNPGGQVVSAIGNDRVAAQAGSMFGVNHWNSRS